MNRYIRALRQKQVYLPILAGLFVSLTSNLLGLDMAIQRFFYESDRDAWIGPDNGSMAWMYHFGVIPALTVALSGLIGYIASHCIPFFQPVRRVGLYLFLVLAIGNGLIANAILKEYWGRPRPSQVLELGGTQAFEPSLWLDASSSGKSFPSGHATMGFYFFALALLMRGIARGMVFAFAIAFGATIGLSRISYGGHFFTDVVWAGIIMWLVSLGLYQLLKLKECWRYTETPPKSADQAKWRKWKAKFLVPLLCLVALLVATRVPRDKSDGFTLELEKVESVKLQLAHFRGVLKIVTGGTELKMKTRGTGFGLPKTRLHLDQKSELVGGQLSIQAKHRIQGFFSDLMATSFVQLPQGRIYMITIPEPVSVDGISIDGVLREVEQPIYLEIDLR